MTKITNDWLYERATQEIRDAVEAWVLDESDWFWEDEEEYECMGTPVLDAIRARVTDILGTLP